MEGAHFSERPVDLVAEYQHHKWREEEAAEEDHATQLPGNLTLSCSRVDEAHYPEGVERREQVEDLEEVVPWPCFGEEIGIPCDEDGRVEDLGNEGDT